MDVTQPNPTPKPPTGGHPLDNPAWYALDRGPHAHMAVWSQNGLATRYDHQVSVFSAVDDVNHEAWRGLNELSAEQGYVVLARRRPVDTPIGWRDLRRGRTTQYVADALREIEQLNLEDGPAPIIELGPDDVDDMLALTSATEPGPFLPRTIEMGRYLGVRSAGRLVAMAGQRISLPGWTEVSAVCVDPSARRRGLAAQLTLAVAQRIRDDGGEAMLHVAEGNDPAHELYRAIGFRARTDIEISVFGNRPRRR